MTYFVFLKKLLMHQSELLLNTSLVMPEKAVTNWVVLFPVKAVNTAARTAITHQFGYARKSCQKLSSLWYSCQESYKTSVWLCQKSCQKMSCFVSCKNCNYSCWNSCKTSVWLCQKKALKIWVVLFPVKAVNTAVRTVIKHQYGYERKTVKNWVVWFPVNCQYSCQNSYKTTVWLCQKKHSKFE